MRSVSFLQMIALNADFDDSVTPDGADPLDGNASGSALQWLAENAVVDDLPSDLSTEHDHYLYGTPKRG